MKRLRMYTCGDCGGRFGRFSISAGDKLPIWRGVFPKGDRVYCGVLWSAELSVLEKALWVGCQVREAMGLPVFGLRLELWTSWRIDEKEAGKLMAKARRKGVVLKLEWVKAERNRAFVEMETAEPMRPDLQRAARCVEEIGGAELFGTVSRL